MPKYDFKFLITHNEDNEFLDVLIHRLLSGKKDDINFIFDLMQYIDHTDKYQFITEATDDQGNTLLHKIF